MKHQPDSVTAFITTCRIQCSFARQAAQQTLTKKGPHKTRYPTLCVTLTLFICLITFSACDPGKNTIGTGDKLDIPPSGWVQVSVHNSTQNVFSTEWDAYPIPVGAISHILGHSSNTPSFYNPNSFDISRQSHPLARVSYQVLRYPAATDPWQNVIINITEGPAGVFGAAVPDSSSTWIRVLSIKAL